MFDRFKSYFYQDIEEKFSYTKLLTGILILFICGLRLLRNFNQLVDISFDDEVKYMRYGLALFDSIKNDWGPTYNLWYKFLSLFEHRPIELYLLNYKVVILFTAISFFTFLYCYGISFITSMWISLCLLVSDFNIVNYPRISQVVVCFFLCGLIINRLFIKTKSKQYIIICFALFIAAFARPEIMLSFLVFFFFTLYFIWKNKTFKEIVLFSLPFFLLMFLLLIVFKLPANTYMGKDRLYGVFCQHYTVKYIFEHKLDYALFIDWIAFSKEQFPDCNTFADIIKKYPTVVIAGMLTNIKLFMLLNLSAMSEFLYPKFLYYKKTLTILSLLLIITLPIFILLLKQRRQLLWNRVKKDKEILFILFILALPGIGSALVFFPRPHYLIFLLIPLVYFLSIIIENLFSLNRVRSIWILILSLLFFWRMPEMSAYKTPRIISGTCPNQSYKAFIKYLNQKNDKPHVIFSNILNLSMITDKNYKDFSAEQDYNNEQLFLDQINANKVDHILVTEFLKQDRRLKNDSSWHKLLKQPEQYGFKKKILFKDCATYLLYKE